ncbi:hypothetical protein [Spiroplasma poulsonii]|uniref:Uncharacterized protein n=1 Tax=Spiroplasma poulsonii TaxID=2138 RepID=A0A2P6F8P9_9MOLU|nr:hypothetical protein [Spiroplasma poulsonii]PQM29796.1 hypothetical protein SMSRO_SF029640 [Spiroplasma poulsonii]
MTNSLKIVQKYKGEEINILTIDDFNKQPINQLYEPIMKHLLL